MTPADQSTFRIELETVYGDFDAFPQLGNAATDLNAYDVFDATKTVLEQLTSAHFAGGVKAPDELVLRVMRGA